MAGSIRPGISSLKTGARPASENLRSFQAGQNLFVENERGRELFILREGEIRITKGNRDSPVELARLGPGAIIGEMSLLDGALRSATGTAIVPTKALVINEAIFKAVSQSLPVWLRSIIKIVTVRLRDTNKNIGRSILLHREKAVAALLDCILTVDGTEEGNRISYWQVVDEIRFCTRLRKGDVEYQLRKLAKREILRIVEEQSGDRTIVVPDREILGLFVGFQNAGEQTDGLMAEPLPPEQIQLLQVITKLVAQNQDSSSLEWQVSKKSLLSQIQKRMPEFDPSCFETLLSLNLWSEPEGSGEEEMLCLQINALQRLLKQNDWIERFSLEVP